MQRAILIVLAAIGCGPDSVRVSEASFAYRAGESDWVWQRTRLAAPRAAHSLVALPGRQFLVIGGSRGTDQGTPWPVPTLDVELCALDREDCAVIGQLAHPVQQAEVARAPDGAIVIADGRGLQIFDPASGTVEVIAAVPQRLVATEVGVAVLGIAGPSPYGVIRSRATGLEMLPNPAARTGITVASALDQGHVLVAGAGSAASLEVTTGTWTSLPALPASSVSSNRAVRVEDGTALVVIDGDPSAYLWHSAVGQWSSVTIPATQGYVQHAHGLAGGAIVIMGHDAGATMTFRLGDRTWLAGPPPPPWSILNATIVLDDATVLSVGGSDYDFVTVSST